MCWKHAPEAVTLTREQAVAYVAAYIAYHNATTAKKLLMELEVR